MTTYTSSSTKRSIYKDDATSNDTYNVSNTVGSPSRGLALNGKSDGDTIKIDGLLSEYNFKASGNQLTITSIANSHQVITVHLSKSGHTAGDILQFNDGNITADYVPASTGVKTALNLTSANGEHVTLSGYKATLSDTGNTLSYATNSSGGRSSYRDNAGSDDIYIVGNTSKGLILNGKSDGDTIKIDGLSTDYNFKANGNKLTITNIAHPHQVITVQLDKLEGSNGDRIDFTDGVIMADYNPKVYHSLHLTGANGASVSLTTHNATLATLDHTFTPSIEVLSGRVAVDYLHNSTVFADANGDGIWNPGESTTTTDDSGAYTLNNPHGNLVASGGTDITTGLVFGGVLQAPEGATMINPLTTLQSALITHGLTVSAAESMIGTALGIDISWFQLDQYDPIAEALYPSSSTAAKNFAVHVQGESVKIANLVVAAGELLVGAAGGTNNLSEADAFAAVFKALAVAIHTDADGVISLTDTALLQTILTNAVTLANDAELTAGLAKVNAVKADFATMLADSAANIDAAVAAGNDAATTLVKIGQIGAFTQGVMANAIQAGAAAGDLAPIVNTYTGTTADTAIAAIDSGQLDPNSTADDAAVAQGNTAPTMRSAAIAADGNTIVVTYSEALTGTAEAGDYTVTLGSGSTTVTAATMGTGVNANQVTLTLGATVSAGNPASITYTASAGTPNSIKDAAIVANNAENQTLASGSVSHSSSSFNLTTGLDNITGTSGNDIFIGTYDNGIATDTLGFGGNDVLDGSGGTADKLQINHLIDVAITLPDALWTNLSNIEKIEINTTGNGAQTLVTGAAFEAAFAAGVDFTTTTSGSGAINISMETFTHAATITATSIAGAQTIVTGSGATTVAATSDAGALIIYGAGLTAVSATTTGAGAQTIGDAIGGGANLVTVVANSNSGSQTITSTSTDNATITATSISGIQTIVTGNGDDTVIATAAAGTNNTINTHAGNDTIVSGLGDDLITGGLGADTMTGGGGSDTFAIGANGSVIGTSMDIITDFNTAIADILTFAASTTLLAADVTATVAGSNVQTDAGGLITFNAADNNLALKIAAVEADVELDAAGSVAMFVDNGNTYVYYAGVGIGNSDDQLIQLSGITTLTTITAGSTTMIA
jgi:hypothetical protein